MNWVLVVAFGELKAKEALSPEDFLTAVAKQLSDKGICVFESQDRRFIICFSITKSLVRITTLDRAAVLHTFAFDFQKQPKILIHFLLGLAFGSDTRQGFDPTIRLNEKLDRCITVGNYDCVLKKLCWKNTMIRGRATTVYYVEAGKEELILKMSWPFIHPSPI